jgi:hypothetical protein
MTQEMGLSQPPSLEGIQWQTLLRVAGVVGIAAVLYGLGVYVIGPALGPAGFALLGAVNIGLSIAMTASAFLKWPGWVRLALLLAIVTGVGSLMSQMPLTFDALGLLALVVLLAATIAFGLAYAQVFHFDRLNIVLAILAFTFSFLGMLLIYNRNLWWLSAIWAGAATIVLLILLYNGLRGTIHQTPPERAFDAASGVTLLLVGVLANLIVLQTALGAGTLPA